MENVRKPRRGGVEQFIKVVRNLPELPPKAIFDQLEEHGYRGQDEARRAVSLLAYRHVRRVKRIFLDGVPRDEVLPKTNCLLIGPTGSGKTHLVELLFGQILELPTVVVDVTTFSETGYVGQDPSAILTRLLHAAEDNPMLAGIGIVCLDEFDKVASGQNNATFAGAGTTKDVTGMGVQRELLKMLEAADVVVPLGLSHATYGDHVVMSTADVSFVAAGAFSGFQQVTKRRGIEDIGFSRDKASKGRGDAIAVTFTRDEVESIANFQAYGFLPELMARFQRFVPFEALSEETLKSILMGGVLRNLKSEFETEGFSLIVDDEVLDQIVKRAVLAETGARGLAATLTRQIEEVAFELFGCEQKKCAVRLSVIDGEIGIRRT